MDFLKHLSTIYTCRHFSTTSLRNIKVAVFGASGEIGQPLSLLLKLCPLVSDLFLYDVDHAVGVASDVSHINSKSVTKGSTNPESLKHDLCGVDIVVIPAEVPRKPWMSCDELFKLNASVVRDFVEVCARNCPKALIAVITNPVNSTVPVAAEVLKNYRVFDPGRLFGVSNLDSVRASTFLGKLKRVDPKSVSVPCIGGHSAETVVPLFSQSKPQFELSPEEEVSLTHRVQEAGPEVVKAKEGFGSSTLAMAYAASRFVASLCRGLRGEPYVVECTYVASNVEEVKYFSSPVTLGKNGVMEIIPLPLLTEYENHALRKAIPELKKNIEKGEQFMH